MDKLGYQVMWSILLIFLTCYHCSAIEEHQTAHAFRYNTLSKNVLQSDVYRTERGLFGDGGGLSSSRSGSAFSRGRDTGRSNPFRGTGFGDSEGGLRRFFERFERKD